MPLAAGTTLENRYRIVGLLGAGGMGAVYRAWHTGLDQFVAIKENVIATPASARQFELEAKVLAHLRHPNLARVIDHFVLPGGAQYLVMDFVEGEDLRQLVRRTGPLDEATALAWVEQVCDALSYLHCQRPPIVHRDVKPSNIKITPAGQIYLVDSGIAKMGDRRAETKLGALGVTPGFSPPEQYGSGRTDARSDIYALGATLYALLTGRAPPESVQRTIRAARLAPPRTVRPDLSAGLASAVEAALETRPTDRPQTIGAFRAMLRRPVPAPATGQRPTPARTQQSGAPPRRKPLSPWVWILGGVGVASLGLVVVAAILGALALSSGSLVGSRSAPFPTDTTPPPAATPRPSASPTVAPTEAPSPTPGPALGDTVTRESDGATLVFVPGGEFQMGCTEHDINVAMRLCQHHSDDCDRAWYRSGQPVHTVALDGFWIDQTEVTVDQFRTFVEGTGHRTTAERQGWAYIYGREVTTQVDGLSWQHPDGPELRTSGDHPNRQVSWSDAAAYCEWAGARLPTEAEWEYAARGPEQRTFPWGDAFDGTRANYCDANCALSPDIMDSSTNDHYAVAAPVRAYQTGVSWCGAFDLAGNVWEWVADWYDETYYGQSPAENPQGPEARMARVRRGGSWRSPAENLLACRRVNYAPGVALHNVGFRCILDIE